MREILFRGKRADNGEWVEGDLFHRNEEVLINNFYKGFNLAVIPETVGEYIGLTDKNGTKIFEGDIIKFHKYRDEPDWVGIVEYEHCLYVAKGEMPLSYRKPKDGDAIKEKFEVQLSSIDASTIEVIGNVQDSPNFWEGGAV